MSHYHPLRQTQTIEHSASSLSPLRRASNASTSSSAYSSYSNPFPPSRTSTVSSIASSGCREAGAGMKRGNSDGLTLPSLTSMNYPNGSENNPVGAYKNMRQSLRSLPQPPGASPVATQKRTSEVHGYGQSVDLGVMTRSETTYEPPSATTPQRRPHSMALTRGDSLMGIPYNRSQSPQGHSGSHTPAPMATPDLGSLQKSSTSHLRTLSKIAQNGSNEDFSILSPAQEVIGLHGRRRLQRTDSTRGSKISQIGPSNNGGYGWGERNWMDKQRKFLQAYEYLCHIGEAKEWIEDIIQKQIPPIVQLEEALRDGVTLAEVVQALYPDRPLRIFRNPKLQFRHSDNIALFFRFLADVELPELFRFELIDLYEKKNIPKVIYCIHALSWLLYRKGIVDFRIGDLVGQLEFEHHELEEMQKGLDRAGVSMPSFSGMGASFGAEPEPKPEPVESEEQRIDRELSANQEAILDLQSQIRGAMNRLRLGYTMQELWDTEAAVMDLQSRIRGDWARQIADYHLSMKRFAVNLQSTSKGFLVRSRQRRRDHSWREREGDVVMIQSMLRALRPRQETQLLVSVMRREESSIRQLQARIQGMFRRRCLGEQIQETRKAQGVVVEAQAQIRGMLQRKRMQADIGTLGKEQGALMKMQAVIRGALQRKTVEEQFKEIKASEEDIRRLQVIARGFVERTTFQAQKETLIRVTGSIPALQAATRGILARKHTSQQKEVLQALTKSWTTLQAASRGRILRNVLSNMQNFLLEHELELISLQAVGRAAICKERTRATKAALLEQESSVLMVQTAIRTYNLHNRQLQQSKALAAQNSSLVKLQAIGRGTMLRQANNKIHYSLRSNNKEVIELQALARAMLLRTEVGALLERLDSFEEIVIDLQAAARGKLVRQQFVQKQRFYRQNMEKVVKIQSFIRGRLQGEAYKSLTSGTNPPVGTIKGFVHLLNDSDFDFDEEIEFERLRKTVVQHVRQNETAEQYIDQLDIKIALLVKNKITLDEVVKHQKHFGGHIGSLLTNTEMSSKDPFDLKALNKTSRKKLEHYQQLFFVLQTQPQYLARLFKRVREQGTAEKDCKRIENLMMGLFGYAQKRREEYYLLKLIARSIKEEADGCASMQDYLRGNFFWGKLLSSYIRSPRDRKFMRDLLGPLVKENIIDNPELDLESDPMQIYRSAINNEELRTGQRSRRPPDIAREEAIRDPETRETFIHHLQDLRDIADQFFAALEDLISKMPYGIRFIAQQTFQSLRNRFPHETQEHIIQIVGHWVWRSYLQPALTQPETWGVVDRGLTPLHKRNLGEVAKVLGQVAAGRLFGGENVYLQPLNSYIGEAIVRIAEILGNLMSVRDAEAQFDIDEFNDLYARTKPTLYIKMADIFAIHQLIATDLPIICPSHDDILREVVRELGNAKNNESEMMGVGSTEIRLTLNPKLHDVDDPDAEIKALFMETKRCILYIIRIQSGANLMEIMVKPITMDDEDRWHALLQEEFSAGSKRRGAYSDANTLVDITAMSYSELKRTALENVLRLEQFGRLTRHNHYQDLLNAIAVDIRTKHRRRVQRQRELEGVRLTLGNLNEKATWLEQQLKSYNDYIEQAMVTLQNKKGKKRFLLPFTKQYNHERELQRSGRVPKFGSFKYSARALADKGVFVSWQGYGERQWDRVNLTISSDEVGVFFIEGSMGSIQIPGASAQVPLDDLLQAQFNNHQFMNLFEGGLKLNVNLFLHLLFRKFYRDE
ncbi:MAG: hypothetical protein M1827_003881 [Pycnora praestabilis]|nr:MAG: hypothetical protein M1827_003881 [Pycnora praestabilis]